MTLKHICEQIGIQPEILQRVLVMQEKLQRHHFYEEHSKEIAMLYCRDTWDEGAGLLNKELEIFAAKHAGPEDGSQAEGRGIPILTIMLQCLGKTKEEYRKKGIPERIFTATMGCFPRFIEEYRASYGTYGFDRDFWTPRQISMKLFRIGELEYEMDMQEGKRIISIHIPSDAVLTTEHCRASYEQAGQFFAEFYPQWKDLPYGCNSWLLAPGLKNVLSEDSNIIRFQNGFEVIRVNEEDCEFLEWVFKRKDIPYQELPEETSLQRNMKQYLLRGGKIGEADGILKPEAWLP